jgi:alpha-L-fucosidase
LFGGADWYNQHPELLPRISKYVDGKAIPQLQELIARYHPDILWFDTPGKLPLFDQIAIVKAVRAAGPDVVINGRAARGEGFNFGDYANTADRPAELRPTAGDWEAIPTTNESYGWNKLDNTYKPVAYFIQLLAKAAAKGGNILLNIGPRGDGTLNPPDVAILSGMGKWMEVNAPSIRRTSRTPLDRQAWGDSTVRGNTIYLHVFDWPSAKSLIIGGLTGSVTRAYLLADKSHHLLAVHRIDPLDLAVALPNRAPDTDDSVVVLEMAPVWQGVPGRLLATANRRNVLLAFDAETEGSGFTYGDGKAGRYYVDGLEHVGNRLNWNVRTNADATVAFSVRYSAASNSPVLAMTPQRASLFDTAHRP